MYIMKSSGKKLSKSCCTITTHWWAYVYWCNEFITAYKTRSTCKSISLEYVRC